MQYQIAEQARHDLFDIWIYIAEDNLAAAVKLEALLTQSFERMSEYPYLGQPRSDLTHQNVLFYSTQGYCLV